MKHKILRIFILLLALPIKVLKPLRNTLKRIFFQVLAEGQLSGINPTVQFDGLVELKGKKIKFGNYARIGYSVQIEANENGSVEIEEEVRINRGTTIVSYTNVKIGAYTMIGEFVSIRDANHGIAPNEFIKKQPHDTKAISIGKDCWIGRGACILPGVTIGDGAIIGANSVVTKSIPDGAIAVGSPAKAIKNR